LQQALVLQIAHHCNSLTPVYLGMPPEYFASVTTGKKISTGLLMTVSNTMWRSLISISDDMTRGPRVLAV
jgi:hypothetical protein